MLWNTDSKRRSDSKKEKNVFLLLKFWAKMMGYSTKIVVVAYEKRAFFHKIEII